jgi:hypothetical protein
MNGAGLFAETLRIASRTLLAAAVAGTAMVGLTGSAEAKWDRTRLQCRFDGPSDYSFSARYENRTRVVRSHGGPGGGGSNAGQSGARSTFSAEFEAASGIGFSAGDVIVISIDTATAAPVDVGSITLSLGFNGDLVGELQYSTQAPPQQNGIKRPFPSNFPKPSASDTISIAKNGSTLGGCTLN